MTRRLSRFRPALAVGAALLLVGCGQVPQSVVPVVPSDGFRILSGTTPPPPCPEPELVNHGNLKAINAAGVGGGDVTNYGNIDLVNSGSLRGDTTNYGNLTVITHAADGGPTRAVIGDGGDARNHGNLNVVTLYNWPGS